MLTNTSQQSPLLKWSLARANAGREEGSFFFATSSFHPPHKGRIPNNKETHIMPPPRNRPRNSRPDMRSRNNDRDRPYRAESDNYRPSDRHDLPPRPPPRHNDYGQSDSYRPRMPQGDFTFRVDKPSGMPEFPADYRGPSDRRGPRRDGRGRGRGRGGRRWQPPPHPSERALVSGATANLPEERLGEEGTVKFRDIDQLSDDDELAMDISSSSETEGPSKKRAKIVDDGSDDAAPKWSNPDPYTALPCPDESTRKKRDMPKTSSPLTLLKMKRAARKKPRLLPLANRLPLANCLSTTSQCAFWTQGRSRQTESTCQRSSGRVSTQRE
ncbi:uncharacterized protein FTOL_10909 [Fusarium torulosum]|uniref:Uncharacterized protein n=1 Tax=Fusarium torulosum TaxID=33205 RepID=A0AAE8MHL1_9HYPO|nr:uncharacterized protein FTOL_10909 [Fusarium torulosum]